MRDVNKITRCFFKRINKKGINERCSTLHYTAPETSVWCYTVLCPPACHRLGHFSISLLTWPLLRFLPDFSFRNQPRAFCSPPERCPLSRGRAVFRFKAHVSLTYIVKVFMSIQPAIVLTIISCSTPSSHQVSLRSFFFFIPQTI